MGSGSSRGKKVAPASVTEVNVYRTEKDSPECNQKENDRLFKSFKIQKLTDLSRSWGRTRPDCHSEGHDSEFSADDDEDIEAELDRVMAEYESRRYRSSKGSQKNSFTRCKTSGFFNSRRVYSGGDFKSTPQFSNSEQPERTHHPAKVGPGSDKEDTSLNQPWKNIHYLPDTRGNGFQNKDPLPLQDLARTEETDLVPGSCNEPSLTLPVILYNGSEEDLMDTIEREFS
ncbi:uncharacterized protein LOC118787245 [Megalops cyprinoides]|uniref:uncharacterized protein LOC118787245 n=1 Tax=Megalops cyprinoides TaxID=118141 RepID=UPI0018646DFE|nr:uncharacterized protein LOC118787245 [Megalops cyprinoides]